MQCNPDHRFHADRRNDLFRDGGIVLDIARAIYRKNERWLRLVQPAEPFKINQGLYRESAISSALYNSESRIIAAMHRRRPTAISAATLDLRLAPGTPRMVDLPRAASIDLGSEVVPVS